MLHELFITLCTNGTSIMSPFAFKGDTSLLGAPQNLYAEAYLKCSQIKPENRDVELCFLLRITIY